MKILYVEDNPSDAELTRVALARTGADYELDLAETVAIGIQKIEAAGRDTYDIILTDLHLPDGIGLDVLSAVRQHREDLAVVLITGQGDEETAVTALKAGADDYMVKRDNYLEWLPLVLDNAVDQRKTYFARHGHMTVIYADSNPADADEVKKHIARHAPYLHLEIVGSAQEVRSRFRDSSPNKPIHVVLLDLHLPDASGLEFLKELKQYRKIQQPVVMLTSQGNEETAVQALKLGAGDYVVKTPGYLYHLPFILENVFHQSELRREQTALRQSESRIKRQVDQLQALLAIDSAMTSSQDLSRTLELLLSHVSNQLGVHAADILKFDSKTQMLDYYAGYGYKIPGAENTHLRLGQGIASRAVALSQIYHCEVKLESNRDTFSKNIFDEGFVCYIGVPLFAKGELKGVLELFQREWIEADAAWMDYLDTLAKQAALAIDNAELVQDLQSTNKQLVEAYDTTLEGWVRALDLRDEETEGHTLRVATLAVELARAVRIPEEELVHVRRGALLHDIGKMGIPDSVLLKPGPLTETEWAIMRRHPLYAYELLFPIEYLRRCIDIPYCHHEKWDGTGYPRRLAGRQIPLAARVFAIVDVWDALRSERPYRHARPDEEVYEYISDQAEHHFDPEIVPEFLKLIKKFNPPR